MKEDFELIKEQLPGICKIASDFYQQPKRRGHVFFVKSPKTADKHESLALYPGSNRYVDFATFLIVLHTNKRQGVFGRNRVADSADIWDISRSVLIVGCTQDGKRYLSHEKSNYGEMGETAIFTIDDGVAAFDSYSDKKDKDFVQERDFNTRQAPQRQDAEQFIYDFLKNGKKPTAELDEAAKAAGISNATLRRAKEQLRSKNLLGLKSEGNGKNKVFYSFLLEPSS